MTGTGAVDLTGQVALISGGLGDIGRTIASTLTAAGATVALADVVDPTEGTARATAAGAARYDRVDVRDATAVETWVRAVQDAFGTPTIAIPAAATVTPAEPHEISATRWTDELRTNLDGAFFLAQSVIRRLLDADRPGRIVFIGSWAADRPHPHVPAYTAAKAGLRGLMWSLALRYASAGILVNEVAPGLVDAGVSSQVFATDPALRARSSAAVPTGQLLSTADVAAEVLRFCDPELRHITGTTAVLDGGISLVTPLFAQPAERRAGAPASGRPA